MGLTPGILIVYIVLEIVLVLAVLIYEFGIKKNGKKQKS